MKNEIQYIQKDAISETLDHFQINPVAMGKMSFNEHRLLSNTVLSTYRICIVAEGDFLIERSSIHYNLKQFDVLLVPPSVFYNASCVNHQNNVFFYLDFVLPNAQQEQQFIELFQARDVLLFKQLVNDRQLENLSHVDRSVQTNFPGIYLLVKSTLTRLLLVMLKYLNESEPTFVLQHAENAKERLLMQIIEYIDAHYKEPLTVRQIARHFNYSENYIFKTFKEVLHLSCKSYLMQYRLAKALQALKSTSSSISDIALECGFPSIYDFSKTFKKKYGYSPHNYRKELEK